MGRHFDDDDDDAEYEKNSKKKKTKKIIICVLILVIVLLVVLIGVVIGAIVGYAEYQCSKLDSSTPDVLSSVAGDANFPNYPITNVEKLNIILPAIRDSWLYITAEDRNDIKLHVERRASRADVISNFGQDFQIVTASKTLDLNFQYSGDINGYLNILLGCPQYHINIYVPNNLTFSEITIDSLNANYVITGVTAGKIAMTTGAGKLKASKFNVTDIEATTQKGHIELYSGTSSGAITAMVTTIGNVKLGDLTVASVVGKTLGSGRVYADVVTGDAIDLYCSTGVIMTDKVSMTSDAATLKLTVGSGSITVDRMGKGSVNAATQTTGDITFQLLNTWVGTLDLSTKSGAIKKVTGFVNGTSVTETDKTMTGSINTCNSCSSRAKATATKGDIFIKIHQVSA